MICRLAVARRELPGFGGALKVSIPCLTLADTSPQYPPLKIRSYPPLVFLQRIDCSSHPGLDAVEMNDVAPCTMIEVARKYGVELTCTNLTPAE